MPELPEVETVKKYLKKHIVNNKILDTIIYYDKLITNLTSEEFVNKLKEETINDVNRRGKWLIIEMKEYFLLSHLRMEGKYFIKDKDSPKEKHDLIRFKLNDKDLIYNDVRKFGRMFLYNKTDDIYNLKPLKDLGVEPLSKELNIKYLKNKFKNKPIKILLLDQSIISGIGNIYADEILFKAGINPLRKGDSLSDKEIKLLIESIKIIIKDAIDSNGSTIKSYSFGDHHQGSYQDKLKVYNKKMCPKCNNSLTKIKLGGRGTTYCSRCQK